MRAAGAARPMSTRRLRPMRASAAAGGLAVAALVAAQLMIDAPLRAASGTRTSMVRVPAGTYLPLYADRPVGPKDAGAAARPVTARRVAVPAFDMDEHAVTNGEFLEFLRTHTEWQRSHVSKLFADSSYLRHWHGDLDPGEQAPSDSPVVNVSWFAARAYLKAVGKRLPTVDQWEYAAAASETRRDASRDPAFLDRIRQWYGHPTVTPLPAVRSTFRNVYGVHDLHGLVWEWTLDFNSSLVTGESRSDSALERSLFCGSDATRASDFEDYGAFMRYAFRSSLEARYAVANLGFRGVASAQEHTR